MNSKLAINLLAGTIEAEGSEEFVRFVYSDFKNSIGKQLTSHRIPQEPIASIVKDALPAIPFNEKKPRQKPNSVPKARAAEYRPTFNTKINLAGLDEFYDSWKPNSHAEKILLFATFLRDNLKIEPCSADDVYSCYSVMKAKTKTPQAFKQAFFDTRKAHYIEFEALEQISITIAGDNHFNQKNRIKDK